MGCWHSLWGACLQVPARSMLFLMFSPFPKGLDNTAVMRLPEKFFQLRVVFTFIHGQNSKHESSFSLDVTLEPRLPHHTTLGQGRGGGGRLIYMVFFVVSQRAPFQLCRVRMAPSVVVLPRGGAADPSLIPYRFSYFLHQSATELISLDPREHWVTIQVLQSSCNNDFHGNSILQPT